MTLASTHPFEWRRVHVADVCDTVSVGIVIQPSQYYVEAGEGIRAFRSANVGENRVVDRDWVYLSPEGHRANSKSSLRVGDVLVVRSGAPGTACVVTDQYAGSNCIDIVFARPRQDHVLPEYLAEFTNSPVGRRHVLGTQGGLALKHFNVGAYKQLELLLPDVTEQKRIVDAFAAWDTAIQKTEQLIAAKAKRKAGLMAELLTGRRRVARFQTEWRSWHLGELFQERVENNRNDLPLLSITREEGVVPRNGLERKDTSSEDKSKYLRICPGDIGYNTMRMWQGVSALSRHEGIVSPAYTVCIPSPEIDGRFASYLFKLPEVIHLFYRYSQGLTSDTWNLKFHHFAAIRVRIPEPEEQIAIASILSILDEGLALLKLQREALTQQKRGLMQKLLTGEWRLLVPAETDV
ncbi:MAG: restriction endonuclease subunit S [Acidithiobacillus sp.]